MVDFPIGMVVATGVIFMLVFVWMGAQAYYLLAASKLDHKPSKAVVGLWSISVIGMFTGPCVLGFAVVCLGFAVVRLKRSDASDADRVGARAVIVGSALALLMIVVSLIGAATAGAFDG